MTRRNAEKISGLDLRLIHYSDRYYCYGLFFGETEIVRAEARDEKVALAKLIEANYQRVSERVRREQRYRCAKCNGIKPLTIHHKIPRARGRDDRICNLIALCLSCHESFHGIF